MAITESGSGEKKPWSSPFFLLEMDDFMAVFTENAHIFKEKKSKTVAAAKKRLRG